jgi:hypothetical protein
MNFDFYNMLQKLPAHAKNFDGNEKRVLDTPHTSMDIWKCLLEEEDCGIG